MAVAEVATADAKVAVPVQVQKAVEGWEEDAHRHLLVHQGQRPYAGCFRCSP